MRNTINMGCDTLYQYNFNVSNIPYSVSKEIVMPSNLTPTKMYQNTTKEDFYRLMDFFHILNFSNHGREINSKDKVKV